MRYSLNLSGMFSASPEPPPYIF